MSLTCSEKWGGGDQALHCLAFWVLVAVLLAPDAPAVPGRLSRAFAEKPLAQCSTFELQFVMPVKETYVRARIDHRLKRDSEAILHELGLTTTDAIRIFFHQVRRFKGLPFDLRLMEDNSDILLPTAMRRSALDSVYDD